MRNNLYINSIRRRRIKRDTVAFVSSLWPENERLQKEKEELISILLSPIKQRSEEQKAEIKSLLNGSK